MATAAEVQAEARTWVGVKLMHQGRTREGGVDCAGVVIRTGLDSGAAPAGASLEEVDAHLGNYSRLPNPRILLKVVALYCNPIPKEELRPADVLALSWGAERKLPMHLGILAERDGRLMLIHAYSRMAKARVVEVGYSADWVDRTCSVWRYKGLEG